MGQGCLLWGFLQLKEIAMSKNLMQVDPDGACRPRPALRLVKTTEINRDQWLEVRRGGIGSSDAAAAVGLNPFRSQLELWLVKTGRDLTLCSQEDRPVEDESTPTYWGTLLEPIVAAHYTKRTGNRVRRLNAVLQHPDVPWMLSNIDREVLGCPQVQLLECKTAGIQGSRLWQDGVPEYVQLQVQHQLAVTGKQAADVAVLLGGQELRIHRIARDEALIRNLMELEAQFWRYVETDTPPPADGSDSANHALRCLYPRDRGEVLDLRQDFEMSAAFSDLLAVRQVLDAQTTLEAQLKQRIQQRMGEASVALFDGGEVSWKRSNDSQTLDIERLQREQASMLSNYQRVQPGSRRFLVRTPKSSGLKTNMTNTVKD
jgi:putative phage-type endonuclease